MGNLKENSSELIRSPRSMAGADGRIPKYTGPLDADGRIPRPVMRGLNASWTKKILSGVVLFSSGIGLALWQLVLVSRKKRYAEFYKNYDGKKEYRKMVRLGVYKGIKANGEMNEKYYKELTGDWKYIKDNWKNPLKDEQGNPIVDSAKFFKD